GKSAQIPLYTWLPDAMEGPTPVSALIHAATMVTAGVYMVARTNAIFQLAPRALEVVAFIGALTAIYAASMGLVQNDIKRVLAYSTVSQLGYMFLACGVAAFSAGIFHLMTHAFFKALLFLGSGSVIHAMSDEQDIRKMGGLKKYIPVTYMTFLIATLAISGIPGLSGFFSKDEILWKSFSSEHGHPLLWLVGFVTAGLTAFYMFRLVYLTFHGAERMDAHTKSHIHESPKSMTVPLMILAVLSVIGGWVGIPHIFGATNYFEEWLAPVVGGGAGHEMANALASPGGSPTMEWLLMGVSVLLVIIAIFSARQVYHVNLQLATNLKHKLSGVYTLVYNKYFIDELYYATVVKPIVMLSMFLWRFVDVIVIDGLLNGSAQVYGDISQILRFAQTGRLRSYATLFVLGAAIMVALIVF
ncbi:MAG: NADH-quinone oxidoreductase subunit L, partial [Candidatus Zixiibacteriota bacterium]